MSLLPINTFFKILRSLIHYSHSPRLSLFPPTMSTVTAAMQQRISTRAFHRDRPVTREMVEELLENAIRAPSGGNTQPWHLYVVCGDERARLTGKALDAVQSGTPFPEEFAMYPSKETSPPEYMDRRRTLGYAMYSLWGVDRKDFAGRAAKMAANWDFFGAPVGIIVTVDKVVDRNGWGHVGALLQSIALLAEERGMATCLQEAWANLGRTVYDTLDIPDTEMVWCGISLGYADKSDPVNTLRSEREPLSKVASFRGFDQHEGKAKL